MGQLRDDWLMSKGAVWSSWQPDPDGRAREQKITERYWKCREVVLSDWTWAKASFLIFWLSGAHVKFGYIWIMRWCISGYQPSKQLKREREGRWGITKEKNKMSVSSHISIRWLLWAARALESADPIWQPLNRVLSDEEHCGFSLSYKRQLPASALSF